MALPAQFAIPLPMPDRSLACSDSLHFSIWFTVDLPMISSQDEDSTVGISLFPHGEMQTVGMDLWHHLIYMVPVPDVMAYVDPRPTEVFSSPYSIWIPILIGTPTFQRKGSFPLGSVRSKGLLPHLFTPKTQANEK